jgi:hypothetical protein
MTGRPPKPLSAGLGNTLCVFSSPKLLSRKSLVYFLYKPATRILLLLFLFSVPAKTALSDSVHNFRVEHT